MLMSSYPGQPCGSGQLVFGSGQPIRAKKTRGKRGPRLRAWAVTSLARVANSDIRFRPVASSLPPLHNDMVKTQF